MERRLTAGAGLLTRIMLGLALALLAGGRYMALFPHIFGYASFLSWFIRLLGPGELLAQGLNVLLTAASGGFLFLLGRRWGGCPPG